MPVVEEKEEKKQSLWDSFLKDAARASYKYAEATIVVCGERGNPFSEIIHSMKSSSSRIGRPGQQLPYFLNYRYVDADSEVDEALHLHTWTVQDISNYAQIPTVVPGEHIDKGRLAYLMCIDISKPSTIKTQLDKWTEFIGKAQKLIFEKVGKRKAQEMKDAISRRIQFYQVGHPEDSLLDEDEKAAIELDRTLPKLNFGVQVSVIICKTDQFGKNYPQSQAAAAKMFDRALLFIRQSSIKIGAAVFTFAHRRQGANIKHYIDAMVMGNKVNQEPQVASVTLDELKEEQVFIPSGFDSEMLLSTSALAKKKFNEVFPDKQKKQTRKKSDYKQQAQSDDQHFLALLRFKIEEEKKKVDKMEKRGSVVGLGLKLPPNVKKFMNESVQGSSRKQRRISAGLKIGGGRKDHRFAESNKRLKDTYRAIGLI